MCLTSLSAVSAANFLEEHLSKSALNNYLNGDDFRYTAPFVVFMVFTTIQGYFSGLSLFVVYGIKSFLTAIALYICFKNYRKELQGGFSVSAVACGVFAFIVWVGLGEIIGGDRPISFDPSALNGMEKYLSITLRIAGASLVVPIMEELLWRSWLMRYLIEEDFTKVPIGEYQAKSFWITVLMFMLVHSHFDYPAAILVGIIYGFYLVKTKNLIGTMIAHGVTNLLLAIFILYTDKFYYW